MIAMILGFPGGSLGSPVPEPDGGIIIQVQQKVVSAECPGSGCKETEPEPVTESAPETETTTSETTTSETTTPEITTPALTQVRLLIYPISGETPTMNNMDSVKYCSDMDGEPFVPKTSEDFEMMQKYQNTLDNYLWMPAHDSSTEGQLQWTNGNDAMGDAEDWPWYEDKFMKYNHDENDCVVDPTEPMMVPCDREYYPMLCEKTMDITEEQQVFMDTNGYLGSPGTIEFPN